MSGFKSPARAADTVVMHTSPIRELSWSERTASGIAQTVAFEERVNSGDMTPAVRDLIESVAFEAASRMFDAVSLRLHGIAS